MRQDPLALRSGQMQRATVRRLDAECDVLRAEQRKLSMLRPAHTSNPACRRGKAEAAGREAAKMRRALCQRLLSAGLLV